MACIRADNTCSRVPTKLCVIIYNLAHQLFIAIIRSMVVSIDPRDPTPIYAQLERGLRAAIAAGRAAARRPAADGPAAGGRAAGQRQHRGARLRRARARRRARDAARRRLVRRATPAAGAARRASTSGGCAPSSRACWPTPTPPDSRSTTVVAALEAHRQGRSVMAADSAGRTDGAGTIARARTSSPLRSSLGVDRSSACWRRSRRATRCRSSPCRSSA